MNTKFLIISVFALCAVFCQSQKDRGFNSSSTLFKTDATSEGASTEAKGASVVRGGSGTSAPEVIYTSKMEQMRGRAIQLLPDVSAKLMNYNFDNQEINNTLSWIEYHNQQYKSKSWSVRYSLISLAATVVATSIVGAAGGGTGAVFSTAAVGLAVSAIPVTVYFKRRNHLKKYKEDCETTVNLLNNYDTGKR